MIAFDVVLADGRILDGCGNPWFSGDLAIQRGRIVEIAPTGTLRGRKVIYLDGRYVAPGFIDIHTHSDLSVLVNRRAESAVRQGVTTHVIGNCGMSPAPVDEAHLAEMRCYWGRISDQPEVTWDWRTFHQYLQNLQKGGIAINLASLAGHAALRMAVMGLDDRNPTPSELEKMKALLTEAMEAGAFGLSTGLVYPPGCFAGTEEIIALCHVVSNYHGLYASHVRGERETILEAAERCRDDERIRFLIMGDGARRQELEESARQRGISNLVFKDVVPHEEIPSYLASMDLSIIHLRPDPVFRTAIPSKTFECMAMGLPILMGVEGNAARIVEESGSGICIPPGDPDAMARETRRLSERPDELRELGRRGMAAVRERYGRPVLAMRELASIESAIEAYRRDRR